MVTLLRARIHCYFVFLLMNLLVGCAYLPLNHNYAGPPERPQELSEYYEKGDSYQKFVETALEETPNFSLRRFVLSSEFGETTIDFYQQDPGSKQLILVFPLLGGKNHISDYFAKYFAEHGFDAAVVHRNSDFKNPEYVDRLEELFRENVIRDRIAMDFFEKEFQKEEFGSFGISRGGINVAMTAGADSRLKYNVIAMGGTDLVDIFRKSSTKRLRFYKNTVMEKKKISEAQFYELLQQEIRTDPDELAKYMDARNTLLILSTFDSTVPFELGLKLREQVGNPKTVFLAADHYTSILYTGYVPLLLPFRKLSAFPMDYVETEALAFYREKFKRHRITPTLLPIRILQIPFNLIAHIVEAF
ncbi:MAG: prolyl oligopeptidase family serine peptidase [Bdellovibrionales bacterium]|nr:prolyl oligopeptidase family serine peptidase [Bdellovibrionales bacterium]